jgi:hypothetical protein
MLSEALGTYVDPASLWTQTGDYRTNKMHDALVWGGPEGIGSWDTMTKCVRNGFEVTYGTFRNPTCSGCPIQIDAKG